MAFGRFITFEGVDKAGKSTQIDLFCQYLREQHIDVLQTREPGGCPVSESIRGVILDPANEMGDVCEAMLYAAARGEHVRQVILPALQQGRLVVSDRFVDSSIAYQGFGRQLGYEYVAGLNAAATRGVKPNLTFFLEMDPERAIARMGDARKDRLEEVDSIFRKRVRAGYDKIIDADASRFVMIDADQSIEQVHHDIVQAYRKVAE